LIDEWEWGESGLQSGWAETLRAGTSAESDDALRQATANGLALGDDSFVDSLEQSAGRRLRARRRGRPRLGSKASAAAAGTGNS